MFKTYTVETRGSAACPQWQVGTEFSSDGMAIEYWRIFFASNPGCFPTACYQLVIFDAEGRLVAELFCKQPRAVDVKIYDAQGEV